VSLVCSMFFVAGAARGAPVSQSFTLKGGWNAVFLQVQPGLNPLPPDGCTPAPGRTLPEPCEIFGAIPGIESVWVWNPNTSPVEFIQNPAQLLEATPYMLSWFHEPSVPRNLYAVPGERAYLIRRSDGAGNYTLTVNGEPRMPHLDWKADSYNYVGFHLVPGSEPTFSQFFAGSPAHAGQKIYVLDNASATWVEVTNPGEGMHDGEAFWVYCKGASEFTGPLAVQLENSAGLDFGTMLTQQTLRVANRSHAAMNPVGISVSSAGAQLKYLRIDPAATPATDWLSVPVSPSSLSLALAAGEESERTLGVLRAGIPAGETRTANLAVTDGGVRILVPVRVTGVGAAGLWVGTATVRRVCQPQFHVGPPVDPLDPDPPGPPGATGSEFSFRVIVHVDGSGNARLLRDVVQLWQESAAQYVLVANRSRLGEFTPGALRDGQPVGRRISTAAFGFEGAKAMSGSFALGGDLTVPVVLPWDDPANPFLHRYHPDHKLIEQVFEVRRDITLQFRDHDADGNLIPGAPILSWGSADVGGRYKEKVSLRKQYAGDANPYVVHIEGTFLLHKVSGVSRLEL